jgi:UDP-glucose 4-epimerase
MRTLITGGAGFIGSHLARHALGFGPVRVLDNFRAPGGRERLADLPVEVVEASVTDADAVGRALRGIDRVFHLAAMVSVEESMRDPLGCVDINVRGLLQVLEATARAGASRLVFCSSAAVYGNHPQSPKREDMPTAPLSPYAVTKLDGEHYCGLYTATRGLSTAALRFFNVFGPGQDPDGPYASAIPRFIRAALAGQPLEIHGDGEQTRDFIHVADIVSALWFAGEQVTLTGVYNVGYGRSWSINAVAARVLELTGSSAGVRHVPARAGDVRHSRADVEKLAAAGWRAEDRRDAGLAETVAAMRRETLPLGGRP